MKNYCLLLVLSINIFSFGMDEVVLEVNQTHIQQDQIDESVTVLCSIIDAELLGINPNSVGRSFIRLCKSHYKSFSLSIQEVVEELKAIQSYMCKQSADLIFAELVLQHSYFSQLVNKLVAVEVQNLKEVNGFTLDSMLDFDRTLYGLSEDLNKFIHKKIQETYSDEICIGESIEDLAWDKEHDIHYTVLSGHTSAIDIRNGSLLVSECGKFLKGTDMRNNVIVWDMQDGITCNDIDGEWVRYKRGCHFFDSECIRDKNDEYVVTSGMPLALGSAGLHTLQYEVKSCYAYPVLLLLKRPTIASSASLQAFDNSCGNFPALKALQKSQAVKQLELEGFTGRKLNKLITTERKRLKLERLKNL